MDDHTRIKAGDIFQYCGYDFRIIHISRAVVYGCQLNTNKTMIFSLGRQMVEEKIKDGSITITKEDKPSPVIDLSKLTPRQTEKLRRNREIIDLVEKEYGPSFEELGTRSQKPLLSEIMEKYSLSRPQLLKIIKDYLQSGKSELALIPKRREKPEPNKKGYQIHMKETASGKKGSKVLTQEDFEHFDEALKLFRSKKCSSIRAAYDHMLGVFYAEQVNTFNKEDAQYLYPSIYQFRRYVSRNLSKKDIETIRTSSREVRNNRRNLPSNSLEGVYGPGDLAELDAVEADITLVSEHDRRQVIGRPTIYVLIDVYTKLIMAFGIGFNVNSYIGVTNAFMNLADDKVKLCQEYGREIEEKEWPSMVIPARVRTDHGAEMISAKFGEVCSRLGITLEVVPPGTGSLKPNIEQWFHQMHEAQSSALTNRGRITKDYGSSHNKTACLTLKEYTGILVNFIADHNQSYMKDYPYTMEMHRNNIEPVPWKLWEYGRSRYGDPKPVQEKDQFLFNFMVDADGARITRNGIEFKDLTYDVLGNEIFAGIAFDAGSRRLPVSMRYDPRKVDHLFFLDSNGNLCAFGLGPAVGSKDKAGLTFEEWEAFRKKKKEMDKIGERSNQKIRSKRSLRNEEEAKKAADRKTGPLKSTGIKEARNKARQDDNREHSIFDKTSLASAAAQNFKEKPAADQEDEVLESISEEEAEKLAYLYS